MFAFAPGDNRLEAGYPILFASIGQKKSPVPTTLFHCSYLAPLQECDIFPMTASLVYAPGHPGYSSVYAEGKTRVS